LKRSNQHSFPPSLRACWIKLNGEFQKRLLPIGLTPDQYTALRWLNESKEDAICQKDLAKLMFTDPNNISGLVKRMESTGMLCRKNSNHDKRIKLLEITHKGKNLLSLATPVAKRLENETLIKLEYKRKKAAYIIFTGYLSDSTLNFLFL
jgi:DNA-binding MarR family transcriptional regulator